MFSISHHKFLRQGGKGIDNNMFDLYNAPDSWISCVEYFILFCVSGVGTLKVLEFYFLRCISFSLL